METQPLPPLAERVRAETAVALRAVQTERKKLERLLPKLAEDAAKCQGADDLRLAGEVLKIALHEVPAGADRVVLAVPWLDGQTVDVPLQRDLSPRANLERLFRRAKGLAQGLRVVMERTTQTHARLARLAQLVHAWEQLLAQATAFDTHAPDAPRPRDVLRALPSWLADVRAAGVRLPPPPGGPPPDVRKAAKGRTLPDGVRLFRSPQGAVVWAGQHALGNDALVTRLLRGRDVWLHVRDRPGAHVVLRVEGQAPPSQPEVNACAVLAAHLSGVHKGDVCEVTVCAGKDVRKVKGAPAGSVYLSQERVVRVVVDAAVVDGFYARRA